MKVDLSCPIELWSFELPTGQSTACSFTFFNLDRRQISSIQVTLTCFDEENEMLSRNVERPMALDANGRDTFVIQVPSKVAGIHSVDLSIDKVWFADGSEWRRTQEARLAEYEPNELPQNRKLEQLRFIAGQDAVGFPSDQYSVWICVCGRVNAADEKSCRRCMRDQDVVFSRFTPEAVAHAIEARERQLEEKARLAREEASKKEFVRQERIRRIKRRRRIRTGMVSATLILIGASYLFFVLGLPEFNYQSALGAMMTGDYAKARTTFQKITDYRDASEQVLACDLRIAQADMGSGDEALIDSSIERLQSMEDYPGVAESLNEAKYQKGVLLLNTARYAEASEVFGGIANYKDAGAQYKQSIYMIAEGEFASGQYDAASERYASLGNFMDATAKEKLCVYQKAVELLAGNQFDEASDLFQSILGFRDVNEQYKKSVYNSAMTALNDGDYEKAIAKFITLGRYEDAGEQHKYSVYKLAGQKQADGDLLAALQLYITIPGYEKADENAAVCAYTYGSNLMADEKYDEAVTYFALCEGYKNTSELIKQCYVTPAEAALQAEDYLLAIRLLGEIQSDKDIDKRLQDTKYEYAQRLESNEEYDLAKEMFASLGDYKDAANRVSGVDYVRAERLLANQEYASAQSVFEGLGDYKDAKTRVLECQMQVLLSMYTESDWETIYNALMQMEGYTPAREAAWKIAYDIGIGYLESGLYIYAAPILEKAGTYEDAEEKRMEAVYGHAYNLMHSGSYMDAAFLFDSIQNFQDARGLRDECFGTWLDDRAEQTAALYKAQDYVGVIEYLSDINLSALPKYYQTMQTQFYESNVRLARALINEDRALEAYPYLQVAKDYSKAKEILKKNIYSILGTWETELGERYAFYLDGTCSIKGESFVFNMPSAYQIIVGKNQSDMKPTFSYSSGGEKTLRLRDLETNKTINLTRIKPAEQGETEDAAGVMSVEIVAGGDSAESTDNPEIVELPPEELEALVTGEEAGD